MENDLNLKATELRLGLPGSDEPERQMTPRPNKRTLSDIVSEGSRSTTEEDHQDNAPPAKVQIVGWPPVRSYRKNCLQGKKDEVEGGTGMYVKVSVDGAPYLRKIDLKVYRSYPQLLLALENMFKLTIGKISKNPQLLFSLDKSIEINPMIKSCSLIGFFLSAILKVHTQRGKATMDLTMLQHMKTEMVTGCLLEMFPGKCSSPLARG
uniref:Auxin-responsive protein n=1 Tax=Gossypium raimondii TaxID=29730 RepID=A0A0D2QH01_GOSRA|nr:hypothetical protein B456_001G242800 [Gossypium raimondii]